MPFSLVLWFGAASAVSNASLFFYQHIAKTGGTSWSKDLAALGPQPDPNDPQAGGRGAAQWAKVDEAYGPESYVQGL